MTVKFDLVQNDISKREKADITMLNEDAAKKVIKYHKSFEQYSETPLVELKELAKYLGLNDIYIKDESHRFGLNAFKVLGGSYSIGQYIAKKLGKDIDELPYETLISDEVKKELGDLTFITATDGNHGRGIAWTAQQLKQNAIVYMPKGSAQERVERIRNHGAKCEVTEFNYDDTVRYCNELAEKNGWIMVQDTAWPGYEELPRWIMQGYMTMAYEAYLKLEKIKKRPTHIFLQAGVGSMASGLTGFFSNVYSDNKPIITIVEPSVAACLYQTAEADDGKLHPVTGEMNTIMAGLACGEPITIGWPVLHANVENFLSVPEETAALGMRVLGNPLRGDERVISGESGAAAAGAVIQVMKYEELRGVKEKLQLDENSVVLLFSTEGDTYFEGYRDIVWGGKYPNE